MDSLTRSTNDSEHWVPIERDYVGSDLVPLDQFRQQLDKALSDLGRLDYDLNVTLNRLRCDLASDTYDELQVQVSALVQPELEAAIADLVGALERARGLTDEVLAVSVETS